MPTFREMDQQVTLSAQMEEMSGPVILINTFTVSERASLSMRRPRQFNAN
jgi:hypothetical protein